MPGNDQTHLAGVDRGHKQTLAQRKLRKPGALSSPCPAEASGLGGPRRRSHPALPLAVLLASCWNSGPVVLAYLLTSFLFFLVWLCSFSQQQDRENLGWVTSVLEVLSQRESLVLSTRDSVMVTMGPCELEQGCDAPSVGRWKRVTGHPCWEFRTREPALMDFKRKLIKL